MDITNDSLHFRFFFGPVNNKSFHFNFSVQKNLYIRMTIPN